MVASKIQQVFASLAIGTLAFSAMPLSAQTVSQAGRFSPAWDDCEDVQMEMAYLLKLSDSPLAQNPAPFSDMVSGVGGQSCVLSATVSRQNFQNAAQLRNALKPMLTNQGWVENNRYAASGVDETQIGFWKGEEVRVAILRIEAEDNPNIAPSQRGYKVTIQMAQPQVPSL